MSIIKRMGVTLAVLCATSAAMAWSLTAAHATSNGPAPGGTATQGGGGIGNQATSTAPGSGTGGTLASTGVAVQTYIALGTALLVGGVLLLLVSRRRAGHHA